MRFAKLENGVLIYAPPTLQIFMTFPPENEDEEPISGLFNVGNPTDQQYLEAGYLPVNYADPPEYPEGYHGEYHWHETDGEIWQVWEQVEDPEPEPPEPTLEDGLRILLGGE